MIHIIYIYFIVAAIVVGYNSADSESDYKGIIVIPILWLPCLILFFLKQFVKKVRRYDFFWSLFVLCGYRPFHGLDDEYKEDIKKRFEDSYAELIDSKPKITKYLLTKAFNKLGLKVK